MPSTSTRSSKKSSSRTGLRMMKSTGLLRPATKKKPPKLPVVDIMDDDQDNKDIIVEKEKDNNKKEVDIIPLIVKPQKKKKQPNLPTVDISDDEAGDDEIEIEIDDSDDDDSENDESDDDENDSNDNKTDTSENNSSNDSSSSDTTSKEEKREGKDKDKDDGMKLKQQGHEYFFKGCYLEAMGYYYQAAILMQAALQRYDDEGINSNESNTKNASFYRTELSKAWSNVTECHLRLKNWQAAEDAASQALQYDAHNAKAIYRRAKARFELSDYVGAAQDADRVGTRDAKDVASICRQLGATSIMKQQEEGQQQEQQQHKQKQKEKHEHHEHTKHTGASRSTKSHAGSSRRSDKSRGYSSTKSHRRHKEAQILLSTIPRNERTPASVEKQEYSQDIDEDNYRFNSTTPGKRIPPSGVQHKSQRDFKEDNYRHKEEKLRSTTPRRKRMPSVVVEQEPRHDFEEDDYRRRETKHHSTTPRRKWKPTSVVEHESREDDEYDYRRHHRFNDESREDVEDDYDRDDEEVRGIMHSHEEYKNQEVRDGVERQPQSSEEMSARILWFRRVIDSYRLRVEDEYLETGSAEPKSLYGLRAKGIMDAPPRDHFMAYVHRALKKQFLPPWFTNDRNLLQELYTFATTDFLSNINYAIETAELSEYHRKRGLPYEMETLRDLALYIEGPIGSSANNGGGGRGRPTSTRSTSRGRRIRTSMDVIDENSPQARSKEYGLAKNRNHRPLNGTRSSVNNVKKASFPRHSRATSEFSYETETETSSAYESNREVPSNLPEHLHRRGPKFHGHGHHQEVGVHSQRYPPYYPNPYRVRQQQQDQPEQEQRHGFRERSMISSGGRRKSYNRQHPLARHQFEQYNQQEFDPTNDEVSMEETVEAKDRNPKGRKWYQVFDFASYQDDDEDYFDYDDDEDDVYTYDDDDELRSPADESSSYREGPPSTVAGDCSEITDFDYAESIQSPI